MIFEQFFILIVFILNLIFIVNFDKLNFFHINLDKPDNKRKFHTKPIPRAGGLLFFINIFFYLILLLIFEDNLSLEIFFDNIYSLKIFLVTFISIFILGYLDDRYNLNPNLKFLSMVIIFLILLLLDESIVISNLQFSFYSNLIDLGYINIFFTLFCFLVYLNAFNMFDGINLQVVSYSIIMCLYFNLFLLDSYFIKLILIFLFFFSYLNYNNKSFLGDSGSLSISFVLGYIFIKFYNQNYIIFADKVLIFMIIPGIDLIRLFILRLMNKKNPLRPDRNHLHHVLLSKFSYKLTLLIIISLILFPVILTFTNINNILIIILTITLYCITLLASYKKN